MSRDEVLAQYSVTGGTIYSPGKFEFQPIYVPHFYNVWNEAGPDDQGEFDDGGEYAVFVVTSEDTDNYPELTGISEVWIWEDEQGFIHSQEIK